MAGQRKIIIGEPLTANNGSPDSLYTIRSQADIPPGSRFMTIECLSGTLEIAPIEASASPPNTGSMPTMSPGDTREFGATEWNQQNLYLSGGGGADANFYVWWEGPELV